MEVLDQFFGNVCELDLVFNFYKVSGIEWSERVCSIHLPERDERQIMRK